MLSPGPKFPKLQKVEGTRQGWAILINERGKVAAVCKLGCEMEEAPMQFRKYGLNDSLAAKVVIAVLRRCGRIPNPPI